MDRTNADGGPPRGRGKNKRMWSDEEEAALVDVLYEMLGTWKVDNVFKAGYFTHAEKLLNERLPGCGLKADPHIQSKVKVLRRQLAHILEIKRGSSGFGWDDEQKMVIGNKQAFMCWAKGREQAPPLFMKPFAQFDKLYEIYSKEKSNGNVENELLANGGRAMSPGEDREEYGTNIYVANGRAEEHYATPSGDDASEDVSSASPSSVIRREAHKRKATGVDVLGLEHDTLSKCLGLLVEAQSRSAIAMEGLQRYFMEEMELSKKRRELLDAEVEVSKKRKELVDALLGLPELDIKEVVRAASIINQDATKIELFFSMPKHVRLVYVRSEIESFRTRS